MKDDRKRLDLQAPPPAKTLMPLMPLEVVIGAYAAEICTDETTTHWGDKKAASTRSERQGPPAH
jgi:hypothetical protein